VSRRQALELLEQVDVEQMRIVPDDPTAFTNVPAFPAIPLRRVEPNPCGVTFTQRASPLDVPAVAAPQSLLHPQISPAPLVDVPTA
jgi:hypothetical protein